MDHLNAFLWVFSNLEIAYIAFMILVFSVAYPILFDPSATTAGKFLLRFVASLAGVIGLVVIGVFVDPSANRSWGALPADIDVWRPALRFVVYSYVAYTISALVVLLWFRKFRPGRLRTAPEENTLPVKLRNPHR